MTGPQPGPYPQYPGGAGLPAEQPKPPLPDTVRNAYYLMLVGAAIEALGLLSALVQLDTIRDQIRARLLDSSVAISDIPRLTNTAIAAIFVIGLIGVGLWIWMAFANRAGKNWARITATVLFALGTVSLLGNLAAQSSDSTMPASSSGTTFGIILTVLSWIVGLLAIIFLYNRESSAYFAPRAAPYGYQPPGSSDNPPADPGADAWPGQGLGQQGYGQGAPPASPSDASPSDATPPDAAPPPGPSPSDRPTGPENMPPPR